jgi:hypothetical protein
MKRWQISYNLIASKQLKNFNNHWRLFTSLFTSMKIKYTDLRLPRRNKVETIFGLQRRRLHSTWHVDVVALHQIKAENHNSHHHYYHIYKILSNCTTNPCWSYWFAFQNFTLKRSAVVMYYLSWLTSALVTGDVVVRRL